MTDTFAFDTNCFINNPDVLSYYTRSNCVIPMKVIEELDNLKKDGKVGYQARRSIRNIEAALESDKVKVVGNTQDRVADNMILSQIKDLGCKLVTSDLNLKIKASSIGLESLEPKVDVDRGEKDFFTGHHFMRDVPDSVFDQFYSEDFARPEDFDIDYYPNQFVVLESYDKKRRVVYRYIDWQDQFVKVSYCDRLWDNVRPRNLEQNMAVDLLMDPDVHLVTITGQAGSGKTLLALGAGLNQVHERNGGKQYDRIIVSRPVQEMGAGIGFLPGTLEEKMRPWVQPIYDNLDILARSDIEVSKWTQKGKIEIEALTYIRGRSISNAFIIIDEAQNLTSHEIKTIITRAGEDTKIVFTGDLEQIDNPDLNYENNGLAYVASRLRDSDLTGHCQLVKGERSELATLGAKEL